MADNQKPIQVFYNFANELAYTNDPVGFPKMSFKVLSPDGRYEYNITMLKDSYQPAVHSNPDFWGSWLKTGKNALGFSKSGSDGDVSLSKYTEYYNNLNKGQPNNRVVAAGSSGSNQQGDEIIGGYKPPGGGTPGQQPPAPNRSIVGTANATTLSPIPGYGPPPTQEQAGLPELTPAEMGGALRPDMRQPARFQALPPIPPADSARRWEDVYNFLHKKGYEGF